MYGEGTLLSFTYAFWGMLGFKEGFTGLKAKIFLKTIPGVGIIQNGIPVAYFAIFYSLVEIVAYMRNNRNSELVLSSILTGAIYGAILGRIFPLLK